MNLAVRVKRDIMNLVAHVMYRSVVESRSQWLGQTASTSHDLLLKPNWKFMFLVLLPGQT